MSVSEFKIEWLFSNLRWFFLISITAVLGLLEVISNQPFPRTAVLLLVMGAIGNLLVMLSLMLNAFRKPLASLTLILDIALAAGLIIESGGPNSPIIFISLVPIITTALRYSWIHSTALALFLTIIYLGSAWRGISVETGAPFNQVLTLSLPYIPSAMILLLAGGAVSHLGSRIKQTLEVERTEQKKIAEKAVETAHQRVRLIFELASTLSATLNYERVLEAALDVSTAGLREFIAREVPQVQIIFLFGMDQSLYCATSRGLTLQDKRVRLLAHQGILNHVLQNAETRLTNDPGSDPELGQLVAMHHCRQAIAVPLRAGFESYGVVVMASPEPNTYPPDFRDLLEAVCNQAVMALQNARLYQNLMEEKERLVAVQEDARKKLARDLHDGPTQTIAAIAMRLNFIRLLVNKDPDKAIDELKQLEELARHTTKEIRQMLFTLRPLILETQGLGPALEQYVQKLGETERTPVQLEIETGVDGYLSKEAQGALFYIVEEAITNARKHSQAKNFWIRLYKRGMSVICEVQDNGKGFNVAAVEASYAERSSLGMMNLRERAALAGGKTVIQSEPGKGTKITTTVPIKEKAIAASEPR